MGNRRRILAAFLIALAFLLLFYQKNLL